VIASGGETNVISRIVGGESIGTRFEATASHLESRKRWLLTDRTQGVITIDDGASRVLLRGGASLLPVGITHVQETFQRAATLLVRNQDGNEIAHGLTNYNSEDILKIQGMQSHQISDILGYSYGDSVIHRNNMVLL
jgi:glutamate 5-kinase